MEKGCPGLFPTPGEALGPLPPGVWVAEGIAEGSVPPQGAEGGPEQADMEAPPAQPVTVLPSLTAAPAPPHPTIKS